MMNNNPMKPAATERSDYRPMVLVVDDNSSVRLLLSHTLKNTCEVITAGTVDEALARITEHCFDALVLDINLCEERDGIALLHAIRAHPTYRHVPAVACTAYARPVERERFLRAGFDQYVSKPFTKPVLLEALERALAAEKQEEEGTTAARPPIGNALRSRPARGAFGEPADPS